MLAEALCRWHFLGMVAGTCLSYLQAPAVRVWSFLLFSWRQALSCLLRGRMRSLGFHDQVSLLGWLFNNTLWVLPKLEVLAGLVLLLSQDPWCSSLF